MKIAYLHEPYKWRSYSVIRVLLEAFSRKCEVQIYPGRRKVRDPLGGFDAVVVAGSFIPIPEDSKFTVVIGLTDPSLFKKYRLDQADLYCTSSIDVSRKFPDKTLYFPPYTDVRYFHDTCQPKLYDCVFAGVADHPRVKFRRRMVSQLRTAGLKILTVGRGWEAHPDDGGFAVGDALVRAYNVAKFSLDITTKSTSLSSRLFQAASCGTPSITIDREDVRGLFLPGEEILLYSDPDASTELIRSYVELANYRELGDMAKRRAIADHTADSRVDAILDAISRMEPKPTQ